MTSYTSFCFHIPWFGDRVTVRRPFNLTEWAHITRTTLLVVNYWFCCCAHVGLLICYKIFIDLSAYNLICFHCV